MLPHKSEVWFSTHSYLVYKYEFVMGRVSLEQADIVQYFENFSHCFMVGNSVCMFK